MFSITTIVIISFIFGLLFGSFFNVVIYRLPIMMKRDWTNQAREILELESEAESQMPFNLVFPHSSCPKCQHQIRWYENIPVISYLFMRGRCSNCNTKISPRYPFVELLTGILTAFTIYFFGLTDYGIAMVIFVWALLILTFIDFDTQLLPDSITLPMMWLGLLANWYFEFILLEYALLGAVFGYLSLWVVYWLVKLTTGKDGFGFGDFKLLAMIGAWLGWSMLPLVLIIACFSGAIIGAVLLSLEKRKSESQNNNMIAFGPYIALGGFIALFWGQSLIDWYLGTLL